MPWLIAELGVSELKRSKQLSQDSLQEIAQLLYEFGYIQNPNEWLKG
jgi:hypothetical protein